MRISGKSFKAVEALLDVALFGETHPVTLADVSRHRGISQSYLEQMFRQLRTHGLVKSMRGPGGGYRLNREVADISVADIVKAVDHDGTAGKSAARAEANASLTRDLWGGLNAHLLGYLDSVTLASLLDATRDATSAYTRGRTPGGGTTLVASSEIVARDDVISVS